RAVACLGTPHHGAPLERGGHALERLLAASPYSAAFARLGAVRSVGITDLRHGAAGDQAVPWPASASLFAIAATTRPHPRGGDGLVPVDSALGRHRDPARALGLPASHTAVITRANHWDLLDHPEASAALARWLA
ncbi:MAG: alpha/beta hydrolase, partial [Burkholderiales bacterium]